MDSTRGDAAADFHPAVREWFLNSFPNATAAQTLGWSAIAGGSSTLIFAPTGSGKTLAAFLWCLDRIMFSAPPDGPDRCRVLYVSPLKALAVDVERNLRAPIAGISNLASRTGIPHIVPSISIRSGDTSQRDRAAFMKNPADILITTPESLYLILTSQAREALRSIETVIIDEIHALVPTKRGAHLALSLERLEWIARRPPQRIGLSATQRPLDEVARFLGGAAVRPKILQTQQAAAHGEEGVVSYRPVTVVDTGERRRLSLQVEVPVEEMSQLGQPIEIPSGPASQGPVRGSIWPAIHPRLVELIRGHRSTLIFVNSRRLAERLAAALNELAGEIIVNAHHGSIAREQRVDIEDRLKSGQLAGLVATSSLELGIDMGAIDLVVQIEAPPSVASGMQRIGRASHQVGAVSAGIIFPKYRGDLVACAAITRAMHESRIEATRYPRNPLDVLAQQIAAMVATDEWEVEELYGAVRSAAPFAELSFNVFEGVLDMLSGLYPSDEFAELRPRITWDRLTGKLVARGGTKSVAIINGGTIPDRGLFGVFLAGAGKGAARVGELDEEMVFEQRPGETFILGASTWRVEEITHDKVIVSPAPGQPGKMPFWHGDSAGRSVELGQQIGALLRHLSATERSAALQELRLTHDLDEKAASNLIDYIEEQKGITEVVPDDQTIVIERCVDELGDWRVCVLSPLGGRVHAPWAMAVVAKVRRELALDVETMWSDDGFIVRFPEADGPPDSSLVLPTPGEIEELVMLQLGASALFAARFREIASRALLLPRRRPGARAPLWQQRKRAFDLLQVASRYPSFPMLLEAYRECLRDVFDMPAVVRLLQDIERRNVRVVTTDTDSPSPFAGSILFRYAANFIYDGDAPLPERRAQALAIDHARLRELLGEIDLRELLDADLIALVEGELQQTTERMRARTADQIHDLLLRVGDLTREELSQRSVLPDLERELDSLIRARRVVPLSFAGSERLVAVEDVSKYRDALGVPLPSGLPDRLLRSVEDPAGELLQRYARSHGPFTVAAVGSRYGLGSQIVEEILQRLAARGRVFDGELTPGGTQREWCDSDVLRTIRRRTLAKLRHEVESAEPQALGRLFVRWQGIGRRRRGLNALLECVESIQGYPIPASILESELLPSRIAGYRSSDLDALTAAGEIAWAGVEPLGDRDGRIALFLTDSLPLLFSPGVPVSALEGIEARIHEILQNRGALFFDGILRELGAAFPAEVVTALWNLVWKGHVSNDSFHALRAFIRPKSGVRREGGFRSRRRVPPATEGRWSVTPVSATPTGTDRSAALAQQLLARYGVVSREAVTYESIPGGFSAVYEVLKKMEEAGRVRRGYFVSGVAANQFAAPAALDLLRSLREDPAEAEGVTLAATDPANPYGTLLKWPDMEGTRFSRSAGTSVILVDGALASYISRGEKQVHLFLPEDEPRRSRVARVIARELARPVTEGRRRAVLLTEISGQKVSDHPIAEFLLAEGFVATALGFHARQKGSGSREESTAETEAFEEDA